MKFLKRKMSPIRHSGIHIVIISDTRHEVRENGDVVTIDGTEFGRKEAIAHLRNISAGCEHIAKMLKENPHGE